MRKYLELIQQTDLIKSLKHQEIESYLTEGSCKTTRYGKNNIVHFVGKSAQNSRLFSRGKWLLSALTSPEIS